MTCWNDGYGSLLRQLDKIGINNGNKKALDDSRGILDQRENATTCGNMNIPEARETWLGKDDSHLVYTLDIQLTGHHPFQSVQYYMNIERF